ncbi:MAG: sugar transferase [Candidatus Caenarcaniphilales bacterium]|nr:sugar transferase [Candidatus Caenarcaniphilales bacterium]
MLLKSLINNLILRSKRILVVSLDFLGLISAILISHYLLEHPKNLGYIPNEPVPLWGSLLVFIFLIQFSIFYIAQLYIIPLRNKRVLENISISLGLCIMLVCLMLAVFCYVTKFALGRDVLALSAPISWGISIIVRLLLVQVFSPKYLGLVKPLKCILLGQGPLCDELMKEKSFLKNYRILEINDEVKTDPQIFEAFAREIGAEIILIDSTSGIRLSNEFLEQLIKLKFLGIQVADMGSFLEKVTNRVPLLYLSESWFLNTQLFNEVSNSFFLRAKRLADICIVILALPFALPLMVICCGIIKLTSKGQAIYKQTRVGENGKHFELYKLRTMIQESEKDGAQWTQENDPRITPIGKILRSTRFDELPQLINILKGDMSLIGPRPERPEFTEELKKQIPYYDLRHTIKPGLSGWAQINEPLATPNNALEKLEYDLFYIRHLSFWLEMDIILKTIRIVLLRKGH